MIFWNQISQVVQVKRNGSVKIETCFENQNFSKNAPNPFIYVRMKKINEVGRKKIISSLEPNQVLKKHT